MRIRKQKVGALSSSQSMLLFSRSSLLFSSFLFLFEEDDVECCVYWYEVRFFFPLLLFFSLLSSSCLDKMMLSVLSIGIRYSCKKQRSARRPSAGLTTTEITFFTCSTQDRATHRAARSVWVLKCLTKRVVGSK